MRRTAFLIWLVILLAVFARGQDLQFHHITIDDGLSHSTVYAIVKDSDGFMWFGTRDGLNRYDGYEIRTYKAGRTDSLQLSNNNIRSLLVQDNGDIWIGHAVGGLTILDYQTQTFRKPDFVGSNNIDWNSLSVFSMLRDRYGETWLGTGYGVLRVHGDTVDHFIPGQEGAHGVLASNDCFSFAEDPDGNIWMGTSGSMIYHFSRASQTLVPVEPEPGSPDIASYRKYITCTGGYIWVGTEGAGLHRFDLDKKQFDGHFMPDALVSGIAHTDGQLLVSVDGKGLKVLAHDGKPEGQYAYQPYVRNGLNSNGLYNIYVDDQDNLWIGTFNGGVNVYMPDKPPFQSYLRLPEMAQPGSSQSVLSLCETTASDVWIGMDGGGLWKLNVNHKSLLAFEEIYPEVELQTGVITALHEDGRGFFWIGTFANGLYRIDPRSGRFWHYVEAIGVPGALQNNNIWDIVEDRRGNLWIGTLGGGLHRYVRDEDAFVNWLPQEGNESSLSNRNIIVLLADHHGDIWIGTEHGGLNQMTAEGDFVRWQLDGRSSTTIPSDVVLCLHEDSRGRIWVGTEGGGLHMIQGDRSGTRQFTEEDGLPSNVINAIEEDGQGILWLSTNLGLCSYNPERGVAIRYGKDDGLSSNQFNPNASIALRSREILFGNIQGLDGFYADQIDPAYVPPSIVYTDFKVFDVSVPVGTFHGREVLSSNINDKPLIRLGRFENAFSIGFAALDYAHPHRIDYTYRLSGLQDDWVAIDTDRRMTTFTNLDPGTYFFQVRASGPSAEWEVTSDELRIERIPSFWETNLFKAAVVLSLLAPFLIYLRYVEWKRKEEHEREVAVARQEILRLKNEQLRSEVEQKNAQLSAALLQSAHKNKTLEGLKKRLNELSRQVQQDAGERRQLRKLVRKIDSEVESKDYWEQFQLSFDQVHQNFAYKLQNKHPELTPNDVRLCCLVRINLTNREVAAIQNISLSGVEKAKYRLKRKLDLPSEQDLNKYILHLS